MKTSARCTFEKVRFDQEKDAHVVISLIAPKIEWEKKRPPIAAVAILDVSGSMAGPKLDLVKKSAMKFVDQLQPGDFFGVVTYSDQVEVVAPLREVTQTVKEETKAKISMLRDLGSTNFSGGMLQGLELLNKLDASKGMVLRGIIFTDGLANVGVATKREQLIPLLEKSLGKASFSCYGYGNDADQELLRDLSQKGNGYYAFIEKPDDALTAFARELGGLLSTYAQNIKLHVEAQGEHKIVEVISDVDVTEDNGKIDIKLTDILSEEQRDIILSVKLAKQNQPLPRPLNVLEVTGSYEVMKEDGKMEKVSIDLKAKVQFVKEGEEQEKPEADLDKLVGLAQVAKAQIDAEQQARSGNYAGAASVMNFMEENLRERGLDEVAEVSHVLGQNMNSAHAYKGSGGMRSAMYKGVTRGMSMSTGDEYTKGLISSAGVKMSNAAQDQADKTFKGGANPQPTSTAPAVKHFQKPEPKKGLSKSRSKRSW